MATTAEPGTGRSTRKRHAIIAAAREAFLRDGYDGTTMDAVAADAAVSKQTVYKHFSDKQRLFTAVITRSIADTEQQTIALLDLRDTDDLPGDLRRFARQHVTEVLHPDVVRLRRIVIAEADHFPDIARDWYASGPERAHATLAELFEALARRGLLHIPDSMLAAQHFNWLVLSIPLNRAMFHRDVLTRDQLEYYADEAVRVFLAAYAT